MQEMTRDVGGWLVRLTEQTIERHTKSGEWDGITLGDLALNCVHAHPDRVAVVDAGKHLTYRDLHTEAAQLAGSIARRGLEAGDVVSFQLPNWYEAMVINLACAMGGWVCNPIVPIYRDAEVGFMLGSSNSKIFFVAESFRGFDYAAMVSRIQQLGVAGFEPIYVRSNTTTGTSYDSLLGAVPITTPEPVNPNAVKLLLYTSGTTGEPKGVLHSHNTLRAEIKAVTEFWGMTEDDVVLMPSPVTHITGYLYAMELCFSAGVKVVFMDRWDKDEAVKAILAHRVSVMVGATPFLMELVDSVEQTGRDLPSLRLFATGGAPVPPALIIRANDILKNCLCCRVYGSSEAPSVGLGIRSADQKHLGATTDGEIFNHEVRLVVPGESMAPRDGVDGEILVRGPEVMLGYSRPEFNDSAFDEEGFFRTGDLGYVTEGNFITISGRAKDLIIRGGENISPKEIEDVLHRHPTVQEAAVVAMPHPRMGETPCAYVVLKEGKTLDFQMMTKFLADSGIARQKHPEKLIITETLPKTASGKVLKHVLRKELAAHDS